MRPKKVLDTTILDGLTKIFREKGYEGASLKDLAEATGLKKASLYHRFPNGKSEMAEAVLLDLGAWVEANVFRALKDESHAPAIRLKNGLSQIKTLYAGGKATCIFRALSMQSGLELFVTHIKNGMEEYIANFKDIGVALGFSSQEAEKKALQTLIEIQGSLIVTKGLSDLSIFENTLLNIEKNYLNI